LNHTKEPTTQNAIGTGRPHDASRRRFLGYCRNAAILVGIGVAGWAFYSNVYDTEEASGGFNSRLYPQQKLHVGIKGICYSVGAQQDHPYRYFDWDMKKDIEAIHDKLGCNGIRIYGSDDAQVMKCARMAANKDFDSILLLPFYEGATCDQVVRKVGDFAEEAEKVRAESGKNIEMMIGNELSTECSGIYPGNTLMQRIAQIPIRADDEIYQNKLKKLLGDLIAVSRSSFNGRLCYGAATWEWPLPWDELDLDILGDQLYWYKEYGDPEDPSNDWFSHVKHFKQYSKPYYNTEFGCCCFEGAFDLGGGAWWDQYLTKLIDEDAQAEGIRKYMELFNKADDMGMAVDGCFLFRYLGENYPTEYGTEIKRAVEDHERKAYGMYESWKKA